MTVVIMTTCETMIISGTLVYVSRTIAFISEHVSLRCKALPKCMEAQIATSNHYMPNVCACERVCMSTFAECTCVPMQIPGKVSCSNLYTQPKLWKSKCNCAQLRNTGHVLRVTSLQGHTLSREMKIACEALHNLMKLVTPAFIHTASSTASSAYQNLHA